MRLLIIGTLKGQLSAATKIAVDRGAAITHATDTEQALKVLRARGADLLMVDVALDIRDLADRLAAEHFSAPIVACGTDNDARAAVAAIHAGAKEYIALPPDPELIAAVLAAIADDARDLVYRDEAMAEIIKLAGQIASSEASIARPAGALEFVARLPDGARMEAVYGPAAHAVRVSEQIAASHVGRTVAEVERDLILNTLKHCFGNRTHAANILGISIRTLRNKLNEYMAEGYAVPSPASGIAPSAA